jgi:transcriptional regulator with XRE-family HTH domain
MSQPSAIDLSVGQRISKLCGDTPRVHIAALLGLDRKTISRWESDLALPDGKSLLLMWDKLKASPDWVLTGGGAPPAFDHRELRLLTLFTAAPQAVQDAVLRALESGEPLRSGPAVSQVFHAPVGGITHGNATIGGVVIHQAGAPYRVPPKAAPKKGPKKP